MSDKQRRPDYFFTKMDNNQFLDYVRELHAGKSLGEVCAQDAGLYQILRKRDLSDEAVKRGILKRVISKQGAFSDKRDEEMLELARKQCKGMNSKEIQKSQGSLYRALIARKLVGHLVREGTIRCTSNEVRGHFDRLSDSEIILYCAENYRGKSVTYVGRNHRGLFEAIQERDLEGTLIEQGIIIRKKRKHGTFSSLSNQQLKEYAREHYKGVGISTMNEDANELYERLRGAGLIDTLVEEGILTRQVKKTGFFHTMSDEEFISYVREHHQGKTIREFDKTDRSACVIAQRRKIIDCLVEKQILVRSMKKPGYFTNMSPEMLQKYITEKYAGITISEFGKEDPGAYQTALKHDLIDVLVEQGVLHRAHLPRGTWKEASYVFSIAREIIEKHGPEVLHSSKRLRDLGYNSFLENISKYHGGMPAFREKIREYMGQPSDKQQLEELLQGYLGETRQ